MTATGPSGSTARVAVRDFTIRSASAFSGYRWPADVILMAVRWYLRHPLSATSVMELLAERGIEVSNRTVLRWVQAFGPQLAEEARKHRRPLGHTWYTDEMFFFRGQDKCYLYRAVDEYGQVVDVLLRDQRDTVSAEGFFAQALCRSGQVPTAVITDHHQPYVNAIQRTRANRCAHSERTPSSDWRHDQGNRAQPDTDTRPPALLTWVEDAGHRPTFSRRFRVFARTARWAYPKWQTCGRPFELQLADRIRCGLSLPPCSCWACA